MRVYVVGFAPADERAATGGFDWYPTPGEAIRAGKRSLRELGGLGTHSVTFVPLEVPDAVAYPDGQTVADRDAVTAWIDANLHLVEVGLDPTPDSNDGDREDISYKSRATCIVYGCGEPADDEGEVEFALPGGGTTFARVCSAHRATFAGSSPEFGVALPDDPAKEWFAERLGSWAAQTRPSAIVRRPDPESLVSESTVAELLAEVIERATAMRDQEQGAGGMAKDAFRVVRELSICITSVEDALTRHNKAVYLRRGIFAITDAERVPE